MSRLIGSLGVSLLLFSIGFAQGIREPSPATQCLNNCKQIENAVESYRKRNMGEPPRALRGLVPLDLPAIPICPSSGRNSYSENYTTTGQGYGFWCSFPHPGTPSNPGRYSILER